MQLVLCNNRVVAHGENFLSLGGVVINTETGAKYENATIAECECCPSDINEVGYEYHSGIFVPCAPYGKGNNNGYFMEVCETCATPRNSGIPIKGGLTRENLDIFPILWENAAPDANFETQTITLDMTGYTNFIVSLTSGEAAILGNFLGSSVTFTVNISSNGYTRAVQRVATGILFNSVYQHTNGSNTSVVVSGNYHKPLRIYGVKL